MGHFFISHFAMTVLTRGKNYRAFIHMDSVEKDA